MVLVVSIFFLTLLAIVGLFTVKEWETVRGRVFFPNVRTRIDTWAHQLSELFKALQKDLEKLPPEVFHVSRMILHEMALATARFFRFLSGEAHRLADLVSYKRSFRRRAPRSEFLKKVSERKSGKGSSVDTSL